MRQTYKKNCKRCHKSFLTVDGELEFCNSDCGDRFAYTGKPLVIHSGNCKTCKHCGDASGRSSFCNTVCRKRFEADERSRSSNLIDKKTVIPGGMSYEALNKMEERKRVFDNKHAERYIRGYK